MDGAPKETGDAAARPPSKGERTRKRILDAAQELFARSGYKSVSLREIAAQSGVTHVGVLHHFESRDAILLALMSRRDREQIVEMSVGVDVVDDPGRMLRIARIISEENAKDPLAVGLYVKLSAEATEPEHPAHPYFRRRYATAIETFTRAFDAWLVARSLPGDPETLARQLMAVSDGLQLQWALDEFSEVGGTRMVEGFARFLALVGFEPSAAELERERDLLRANGYVFA